MNATLELIKAKQNAIKAEANLKAAKERAAKEARIRTFAPLKEILTDVLDLPSNYSHATSKRPVVREHLSFFERDSEDSVSFWEFHSGKTGLRIAAREDGTFGITPHFDARTETASLEVAKDKLVSYLAFLIK